MTEIIDLYDNARRFVRTAARTSNPHPGENKLSVHVWILNLSGQFLLQQRVASAKKFPNMWGQTGGGARAGESSWDCCVRETREELGISPDPKKSIWVGTFKRPMDFVDVWLVYHDVALGELTLQPDEVQDVKWATLSEIEQMRRAGTFIPSILPGLEILRNYLNMEQLYQQHTDAR